MEALVQSFETRGFAVKHSEEFRKHVGEARWIMSEDGEPFDDPRFVERRDASVDATRKSKT